MNITVFANSTLYTPMPDSLTTWNHDSTLHFLREYCPKLDGAWLNGLTILNIKQMLPQYLRERHRSNWVIINVGAVECYSHKTANFLQWCSHYLNFYGCDPLFSTYVLPKMLKASDKLCSNEEDFHQLLSSSDFASILDSILRLLEGFSVIVIGMNEPKTENVVWKNQAGDYEYVMAFICKQYNNVVHIDSWNLYNSYVVDTTHMTPEGHSSMFSRICNILESGGHNG